MEISTSLSLRPSLGRALRTRGEVLHKRVDSDGDEASAKAAVDAFDEASAIFGEAGNVLELRVTLEAYANFLDATGHGEKAKELKARAASLNRG